MILLTPDDRFALRANDMFRDVYDTKGERFDPSPVLKLFSPVGAATWLATELGEDGDTLFGLADLGFGCPELGSFSLAEIASIRLPFGLFIERDVSFESVHPLTVWLETARHAGSILAAESLLRRPDQIESNPGLSPGGG
ncbi:DUF2958 domain-containing protein [Sphingomonas sp. OK281]|uniref:DUF2958 domain-containing protein n=1 Tax=Sphingomonas sp. OK281 TaxID=1881067 RepID=UPI0008EF80CA|nr:DUF2958 domain-containing protein [Sphingomonas sp. OK281]SFO41756.1 Protein of unknown function [Sphingomonas sp. OK281]